MKMSRRLLVLALGAALGEDWTADYAYSDAYYGWGDNYHGWDDPEWDDLYFDDGGGFYDRENFHIYGYDDDAYAPSYGDAEGDDYWYDDDVYYSSPEPTRAPTERPWKRMVPRTPEPTREPTRAPTAAGHEEPKEV